MKQTTTVSLLKRLEGRAFEHAVFLTYSVDLPFFEDTVLRYLLRRECRNVAVFADEAHVAAQQVMLGRMGSARGWWPCGRAYSLTPVFHQGSFHPKIAFLVGADEVEVWIGSGNLEPGGLRANLEILNVLSCGRDGGGDEAAVIGDTWRYIRKDVAQKAQTVVDRQLDQVDLALPWLSREHPSVPSVRLVTGPNQDAVAEIVRAVGRAEVRRLILLAPFFDPKLAAASALIKALKPRNTAILVQPDTVSFPGDKVRDLGVGVYRLRTSKDRYMHAKVVIVEAKGRSVMLAGSHNISEAALRSGNFEAGIIRVSGDETAFTDSLGIEGDLSLDNKLSDKALADLKLRLHDNRLPANVKSLLIGAELENGSLTVIAAKPIPTDTIRLLPYANGKGLKPLDLVHKATGLMVQFNLKGVATDSWSAIALDLGKTVTAPVPLTRPAEIVQRFKPKLRPPKAVEEGRLQDLTLPEVDEMIQQFAALMADEFRARKLTGRHGRDDEDAKGAASKAQSMRYEDFVVSWRGPGAIDDNRVDGRTDMEWLLASLVHVTGGSRVPMPVPRVSSVEEVALPEDSGLADEAVHLEEAMIGGKMEEGASPLVSPADALPDKPKESRRKESRLKSAENVARQLKKFAKSFPWVIHEFSVGSGDLPLNGLEGLLNAGRFLTSMIGRKEKQVLEEVEYLPVQVWAEFNVGLLHVLTSRELGFIRRLPLARIEPALARKWQTALAGYLLLLHAFHAHEDIEAGTRLSLRIGLRLAGQILGIDQKGDGADVADSAQRIIGSMHPAATIPPLDWPKWVQTVSVLREVDAALWKEFEAGADIQKASRGNSRPEPGQWVWWPHVRGLAIVTGVQGRNVRIIHEPESEEKIVGADFVVPVDISGAA